jgi:hypothetical protein
MSRSDLKDLGELLDEGRTGLVVIAATDQEAHVERVITRAATIEMKQLRQTKRHSKLRSTKQPKPEEDAPAI